ncbi:hypothetical protein PENSPDRAFT_691258 [Peniophora sp. CONT]|nr:hypothetical protein PENSPDRAFT_691258 [Peniophora sp. CONT]
MSTLPMKPDSNASDGRLSTPTPLAASGTQPTPSRTSTPTCASDLSEWTQGVFDVQPSSPPPGSGLPSASVGDIQTNTGAFEREVVHVPADPFAHGHYFRCKDLVQRDIDIEHPSALHKVEPWPPAYLQAQYDALRSTDYPLLFTSDAPHPFIDPRNADITVDTSEPESAHAQTKKRKRGAESEPVTKKTRVANGAGASGSSNVGARKAPRPASFPRQPELRNVQPIPETLKAAELFALLNISQIWCRDADGEQDLAAGVLYNAVAIRPSLWGNNGRLLATKEDVQELYFVNCCGNTKSDYTNTRHAFTVAEHYPRLREHCLPMIDFKLFLCLEEDCKLSRPRPDTFKRDHAKRKCAHRDVNPDNFKYLIENPATYTTAHKHVDALRQRYIDEEIAALKGVNITHEVVARVMDNWDVVPDAICEVLINAGYHCFSEAEIKARDLAFTRE